MITDLVAIKFSNEQIRRCADQIGNIYYFLKKASDTWDSNNYATFFPGKGTLIDDGSTSDGRNQITDADVLAFMSFTQNFLSEFEANQSAYLNLILKIAVNP